jgi:hypothetical protein
MALILDADALIAIDRRDQRVIARLVRAGDEVLTSDPGHLRALLPGREILVTTV